MIDLDEIERRIPSPATECAFCHRLATAVCPVCGTMTCEDHRGFAARAAIGTDCEGVAMIPAHHDAATMDRVALVAEVRRLRAYMTEIGAEDVRCTCGSGAHPRHCKRHPWCFAAHVAELNSDNASDWMSEAMDIGRERDESRAENARLRADLATARAAAHTADDIRVSQIEELCAVIDGSPDEPTDDELAAHTGAWLARLYNGAFATMTATAVRNARGVLVRGGPYAVRWWAIDSDERFCPRHVVTVATATLGAGPRDADGREVTP